MDRIRNFCIIAHIDHGKSTLADRLLQKTGTIEPRRFRDQVLDDMELERERGITIKARAVEMIHRTAAGEYFLNLIDTPGHVDFSYEVSRSLAACEGAVLVVDAAQGVEAQTVANVHAAIAADLEIVPMINKIDLPAARPDDVALELEHIFGFRSDQVILGSARTGQGVDELMRAVVERVPPPEGDPDGPFRALIFDSQWNDYRGAVAYVRVVDGAVSARQKVRLLGAERTYEVQEVGKFRPDMVPAAVLRAGEVGYVIASIKSIREIAVGDTMVHDKSAGLVTPLPGYVEPKPMVFCSLYPVASGAYAALRDAVDKLSLNDSSFTFVPETSALGFGFRCGFLGMLHMEIVQERLEREHDLELVQTAPSVNYEVDTTRRETFSVASPAELPEAHEIVELREPFVRLSVILPAESLGPIVKVLEGRRGVYSSTDYLSPQRVHVIYEVPLAEILFDFYDILKSATRGYGTMDYEYIGHRASDLVKLRILIGGDEVDALSVIVHRDKAQRKGRSLIARLKEQIPRHLFQIPLQAAIGGKVIARENIQALRKNVIAKCYGGDITRKRKLLERQKEGKRRMKSVGRVEIPQEAFLAVIATED